jgi:hypothetical protein
VQIESGFSTTWRTDRPVRDLRPNECRTRAVRLEPHGAFWEPVGSSPRSLWGYRPPQLRHETATWAPMTRAPVTLSVIVPLSVRRAWAERHDANAAVLAPRSRFDRVVKA